jgi:UDP-glucose 4-epimerase
MLAMETTSANGERFNVASGTSTSILDLLMVLEDITGVKLAPRFMPERVGDVKSGEGSIAKIERALGYRSSTAIREGLAQVVDAIKAEAESAQCRITSPQ